MLDVSLKPRGGTLPLRLGVMGCVAMERARDRELVIELRTDADRGSRRCAGAQLERRGQPPMLERHRLCAAGDHSASVAAGVAHAHLPGGRSAHMPDELPPVQRLGYTNRRFGRRRAAALGATAAGAAAARAT